MFEETKLKTQWGKGRKCSILPLLLPSLRTPMWGCVVDVDVDYDCSVIALNRFRHAILKRIEYIVSWNKPTANRWYLIFSTLFTLYVHWQLFGGHFQLQYNRVWNPEPLRLIREHPLRGVIDLRFSCFRKTSVSTEHPAWTKNSKTAVHG